MTPFERLPTPKACGPGITRVTGLSIIPAVLAGRRDPAALAKLRNEHCKISEAGLAQALHGHRREEHLSPLPSLSPIALPVVILIDSGG